MVSGAEDLLGSVLGGRYRILEFLGEGSGARVYLAKDLQGDRFVAIKVIKSELTDDGTFLERFQNEAKTLAKLRSPFAVRVFDYGIEDRLSYIIMEFVPGRTLDRVIKEEGALGLEQALTITRQVAQCLRAAQEADVVHRDIKPANIMVTADGSIKVMDFGIAKSMIKTGLTQTGVLGTPYYVSPEQADGSELDTRSDIYSLGCTLYQMLTGHPPYEGDNPVAVIMKHLQAPTPRISKDRPDLDPRIDEIAAKCIEKDREKRFWPRELVAAIDDLAAKLGIIIGTGEAGVAGEELNEVKRAISGLSQRIADLQSELDSVSLRPIPSPAGLSRRLAAVGMALVLFLIAVSCGVGSFLPRASTMATPTPINLAEIMARLDALETLSPDMDEQVTGPQLYSDPSVYLGIADSYYADKNYSQAIQFYDLLVEMDAESAHVRARLGWSHYHREDYAQATFEFERSLELDPSEANSHNGIGWCYKQMGDCANAVVHFRQALDLDPGLSSAMDGLAACGQS